LHVRARIADKDANMKRSRTVVLSLLSATALSLAGCTRRDELKTCVDRDNVMQDDDKCRDIEQHYPFGGGGGFYHWNYGGRSSNSSYDPGRSVILGGSSAPDPGVETATPSEARAHGGTISDGHVTFHGFGAMGHGGEGEGHGGEGEGHGGGHGGAGE
jgi:hypothetical protein